MTSDTGQARRWQSVCAPLAVLSLLLAASLALPAHAQALAQAVRIALEKHPRIAELREAAHAAEVEVEIPRGRRDVQVALEGGLGRQHTSAVGSSSVFTPTLRLRKLVHDAGRTEHEIRLREARLQAARSTLASGQEDLALEVFAAYLQVARAQATLTAAQRWLDGLRAIASMTHAIQLIDRGRQFDNALALGRVQRAQAEVLAHQASLDDAMAQLRGLAGQSVEPVLPIDPVRVALREDPESMLGQHPRMRAAQAAIAMATAQSAIDRLHDRPSLSVEAFASGGHDAQGRYKAVNNVGVQLVGNVSLLDGGAGAATSKASFLRLRQAEQSQESTRVELSTALSRLRALLEGRQARITSFERAHQQATALAARMREQFRAGRRPLIDLLSQETEIYQMKLSTVGEHHDALLTQARLAHAGGSMLAALAIDAPADSQAAVGP